MSRIWTWLAEFLFGEDGRCTIRVSMCWIYMYTYTNIYTCAYMYPFWYWFLYLSFLYFTLSPSSQIFVWEGKTLLSRQEEEEEEEARSWSLKSRPVLSSTCSGTLLRDTSLVAELRKHWLSSLHQMYSCLFQKMLF